MPKLAAMTGHPNRSTNKGLKAGSNPTPAMIARAREDLVKLVAPDKAGDVNASREIAAELVYSTWRTWQNWEADAGTAENRRMHPATWELFQVKLAALKMLAEREISPAHVRGLGLNLPASSS